MKPLAWTPWMCLVLLTMPAWGQDKTAPPAQSHFFGRRVAHYMHHTGAPWLIRATREKEENTTLLLKALQIKPGWSICDLGCGNGYHSLKMAKMVGVEGKIYGVDIQKEMLRLLEKRAAEAGVKNVVPVLGKIHDPNLKPESCDMIILVDVYHEMSHPKAMLAKMRQALKPNGQLVLVEFRAEDAAVPIKLLHKMSRRQMVKEVCPSGFRVSRQFDELPWQHVIFFQKTKRQDLNVLFVGNQDTASNKLPQVVAALAKAQGRKMTTQQVTAEAFTLQKHLAQGDVQKALGTFKPDVVVLQEEGLASMQQPDAARAAARKLQQTIMAAGAKPVLFMTWPRHGQPQMLQALKRTSRGLGDELGAQVAPVGEAFAAVMRKDRMAGLHPKASSQPTAAGSYLAACVLYATITGQDPRGLPSGGLEISDAARVTLQNAAWQSLNQPPAYSVRAE